MILFFLYMGIYRRLVQESKRLGEDTGVEPSDRLITPANAMTASRFVLANVAGDMLLRGQRGAIIPTLAMAASDGEGNVARLIDKLFPNSGLGTSTKGAEYDPIADAYALLVVSSAALIGPKVSVLGKSAVGITLGQEGIKAAWAFNRNRQYQEATQTNQRLTLAVNDTGKEAMLEKFIAVCLAVATNDIEQPFIRTTLGAAALAHATVGSARGAVTLLDYEDQFNHILQGLPANAE